MLRRNFFACAALTIMRGKYMKKISKWVIILGIFVVILLCITYRFRIIGTDVEYEEEKHQGAFW